MKICGYCNVRICDRCRAKIAEMEVEMGSWRRVAERLQTEKYGVECELEKAEAALAAADLLATWAATFAPDTPAGWNHAELTGRAEDYRKTRALRDAKGEE